MPTMPPHPASRRGAPRRAPRGSRLAAALLAALVLGGPALAQPDSGATARFTARAAQPLDAVVLTHLADALEAGDTDAVLASTADRVELSVLGQGALFSRSQARLVLQRFFRQYPPARAEFAEQALVDDGRAAMGRYWGSEGGEPLALYARFQPAGDAWRLVALRLDRPSRYRLGGH